jgi:hypothetical protein
MHYISFRYAIKRPHEASGRIFSPVTGLVILANHSRRDRLKKALTGNFYLF